MKLIMSSSEPIVIETTSAEDPQTDDVKKDQDTAQNITEKKHDAESVTGDTDLASDDLDEFRMKIGSNETTVLLPENQCREKFKKQFSLQPMTQADTQYFRAQLKI